MSQHQKLTLTDWKDWYEAQRPELFDLASFECFINKNQRVLIDSGVLAYVRHDYYVVSPDFDRYIFINVSFGLLASLLRSRTPTDAGAL